MPKNVTTARGVSLNMDELIAKSKRPLNFKEPASQIDPAPAPVKPVAVNMRGFMPAQSSSQPPAPDRIPSDFSHDRPSVTPVVEAPPGDTRTMAELTGIRIDKTETIKVRKGAKVQPGDGTNLAKETAANISKGLRLTHGEAAKTPVLDDLEDGVET